MKLLRIFLLFAFVSTPVFAQEASLQARQQKLLKTALSSGPMVGRAEMREVMLWAQTTLPAEVFVKYWEQGNPKEKFQTNKVQTIAANAFTAHMLADKVQPGKTYEYELFVGGLAVKRDYPLTFKTPPLWLYRTDPPQFSFAFGSCHYSNDSLYDRPGRPYGNDASIFKSIAAKRPDIMIWGGDNIYLREADWNTRTGIYHRYTHSRAQPEIQQLLATSSNYAIWDDHDFGPNDSDRGFWNKETTLQAFKDFWANPSYGMENFKGCATTFEWGDAQFFLLDNRYHRSPNNLDVGERTILGREQKRWLIDALVSSKATFKIIVMGGQFLNNVAKWETYATYPDEQLELLKIISDEKINGVVFFSGDRHHTEMSRLERTGTYPLTEFTISPLTSGVSTVAEKEENFTRVAGTLVMQHNFAIVSFSGPSKEREMKVTVFNKEGVELWNQVLKASELR
ncbi:MAG TPA: alkaline phosphatase D family protein [Patescibacteria group bacterium]|nr:alkaline phosphatase D family protein [Patescibacteria group bacterium]